MLRLALAAFAALALAGCGQSDEDAVRETVGDYFTAFADRDADRVCEMMTPAAREELAGGDCVELMEASLALVDDEGREAMRDLNLDFATVTVRGDKATLASGPDDDEPLELQKIDGEWRVEQDGGG